jgi:hypothetical protein
MTEEKDTGRDDQESVSRLMEAIKAGVAQIERERLANRKRHCRATKKVQRAQQ